MSNALSEPQSSALRVAFVGAGWIGTRRAKRLVSTDAVIPVAVHTAAVVDPDENAARQMGTAVARSSVPCFASMDELLAHATPLALDAVVIATPSAQHAEQAERAFSHGLAAFVQKPLARTAAETRRVVQAARQADRSLGVDFSYRGIEGMTTARRMIAEGAIGHPFAVDLVFHNAYGPDKPWFYERTQSGGGCVMDLGCHLVDLLLWLCPDQPVLTVHAQRFANGTRLAQYDAHCEDFALATLTTAGDVTARLACSWRAHAGQDAVIAATVYGTQGGIALGNVNGSFSDFEVHHVEGTHRTLLGRSHDTWDGVEIRHWAQRVSRGERFCAERAAHYLAVADVIDRLYEH